MKGAIGLKPRDVFNGLRQVSIAVERSSIIRIRRLLLFLFAAASSIAPSYAVFQNERPSDRRDATGGSTSKNVMVWGGDQEGGGPFIMPRDDDPAKVTGFENDLAELIAGELAATPQFKQGEWKQLLMVLERGDVDCVINGYEFNAARAEKYRASLPYFVYSLNVVGRRDETRFESVESFKQSATAGKWRIGVLESSAADEYASRELEATCEIKRYNGATEVMALVVDGRLDATIQDSPVTSYYVERLRRFPKLKRIGEDFAPGYYVVYSRKADVEFGAKIDAAVRSLHQSGKLKTAYEAYGLWSDSQLDLPDVWADWSNRLAAKASKASLWTRIFSLSPLFLKAAGVTVLLTIVAMPMASLIGTLIAVLRCQGEANSPLPDLIPPHPALVWPIKIACEIYVEVIRGTPLMFQLFVIYFVLPAVGVRFDEFWAGAIALAINYSAYEAEIVRLGLQAIPKGQLEAALSLGMSPRQSARRIILPQAWRLILPATANDFIAMFKDTAVCSAISVVELTKQFNISANSSNMFVEAALITSALYLLMSYPLSLLTRWVENRLKG